MKLLPFLVLASVFAGVASGANDPRNPTWWDKYQWVKSHQLEPSPGTTSSLAAGANVDVSNECGPQSETFITLDPGNPANLAAGSNEIFRLPMRGYSSFDDGASWTGVDLPLPPAIGANGIDFGSDPTLAFDTKGTVFYGYIVVFFGNGAGINGTEMAVARSTDGGRTYPAVTYFGFQGGQNHFNDKPMIAADTNAASAYRDNVYVAWDAAAGGSGGGGVRFARSTDGGATFVQTRIDAATGPGRSIGADPFVGPDGEVYVAWNDYAANTIAFNRSFDGGSTWGTASVIAPKTAPFDVAIPAESFRRALVYPACDADRSAGPHRGQLTCTWMDVTAAGYTDIFLASSDDRGAHWSVPRRVDATLPVDRFNQWVSTDPVTGEVNVAFSDTRNDTTGQRYGYDEYLARSSDGGATFASVRVSTVTSNEHDCDGVFPCSGINYGNQQGDYEGVVAFGGETHPVWTDSRRQLDAAAGCRRDLAMEEVFTATVR